MKTVVFLFSFLLFSQISIAADVEVDSFTIDKIRMSDNSGNLYILPKEGVEQKNSSCAQTGFYAVHRSAESFNNIQAMLLTAATTSLKVKAWGSVDDGDCLVNFQRLTIVEIDF